jgi:hypothetical protein
MGALHKELRTSPVAAVVNGVEDGHRQVFAVEYEGSADANIG